jgi:hypothetical protein
MKSLATNLLAQKPFATASLSAMTWHTGRYAPLHEKKHCEKVLQDLLTIPPFDLGRRDFALQNLLCANGLSDNWTLNIPKCLNRLDELTTFVKNTMDKNIHRFKANPSAYDNCEPMWRMSSLVTSMKREFGAKYDPEIANDILNGKGGPISDSSPFFINGLLADDPNKR